MSKTPRRACGLTSEHILNTIQMNLFEGGFFFIILMDSLKYQVQDGDVTQQ